MVNLYINEEHCTSLEQLRNYFGESPYQSSTFYDLIDYARSGDMSAWLREKGESNLADKLDSIAENLGDGDYFSRLSALMTGSENMSGAFVKPDFSTCFQVEDLYQEENSEEMKVQVLLKVLSPVNETYELAVRTSWGLKGDTVNPFYEKKDGILTMSLKFRKRPGIEFKIVGLMADGKELEHTKCTESGKDVLEFEVGTCRFKMIRVEHGTFMMGAMEGDNDAADYEKPVHQVTLTNDYYIGETQVTQELWKVVMGSNPSRHKGNKRPVESLSWNDCQSFIERLNAKTGKHFRLPTEAEWEYAARGGNKSEGYKYSGSNNLDDVAWYYDNSGALTHDVATKQSNELGIYDMSGNVWEWCQDWGEEYIRTSLINPKGPKFGAYRVSRGGCYSSIIGRCHSYTRIPSCTDCYFGLRLAYSEFHKSPDVESKAVGAPADDKELNDLKSARLGEEALEFNVGSCYFKMIRVRHGLFMMGASEEEKYASDSEKPAHLVELTNDYYICDIPVTQNLWKAVMGSNPSNNKGNNMPVENISWYDCQNFISQLNDLTKENFRLPTEAEWEFAARGGIKTNHTKYSGSDDFNVVAQKIGGTYPVAEMQPNELGIYDMCGNVGEWCADWYGKYSCNTQKNPICTQEGKYRVVRGLGEPYHSWVCTVYERGGNFPQKIYNNVGLRLCLSDVNSTTL